MTVFLVAFIHCLWFSVKLYILIFIAESLLYQIPPLPWLQTITEKAQLKTPNVAIIFRRLLKRFLKRKFHTFPSIFYIMAQHPFR